MNLALVRSEQFNGVACDFYRDKVGEIWMTREQIGQALEYSDPRVAIAKIHAAHSDRLDQLSTVTKMVTVEGNRKVEREVILYSARGVYEICRWSRQPKADAFMDFVWDVIEALRTGQLVNNHQVVRQLQECIRRLTALEGKVNQLRQMKPGPVQILLPAYENVPSETVDGHPRQRTRIRSYCAIDRLPEQLNAQVNQMIESKNTYQEISRFLNDRGHSISKSAVGRYAKKYLEHQRRLRSIREQTLALVPK